MIKQSQTYIQDKKKKFLYLGIVWGIIVAIMFAAGVVKYGERANTFTIIAAVLILPFAQNLTRFFSFNRYKDPKNTYASLLETLRGEYALYHGAILPDQKYTFYFEHVVVTEDRIYFISGDKNKVSPYKTHLVQRLEAKGIGHSQIYFMYADTEKGLKSIKQTIQQDIDQNRSNNMEKNMHIIEGMLM